MQPLLPRLSSIASQGKLKKILSTSELKPPPLRPSSQNVLREKDLLKKMSWNRASASQFEAGNEAGNADLVKLVERTAQELEVWAATFTPDATLDVGWHTMLGEGDNIVHLLRMMTLAEMSGLFLTRKMHLVDQTDEAIKRGRGPGASALRELRACAQETCAKLVDSLKVRCPVRQARGEGGPSSPSLIYFAMDWDGDWAGTCEFAALGVVMRKPVFVFDHRSLASARVLGTYCATTHGISCDILARLSLPFRHPLMGRSVDASSLEETLLIMFNGTTKNQEYRSELGAGGWTKKKVAAGSAQCHCYAGLIIPVEKKDADEFYDEVMTETAREFQEAWSSAFAEFEEADEAFPTPEYCVTRVLTECKEILSELSLRNGSAHSTKGSLRASDTMTLGGDVTSTGVRWVGIVDAVVLEDELQLLRVPPNISTVDDVLLQLFVETMTYVLREANRQDKLFIFTIADIRNPLFQTGPDQEWKPWRNIFRRISRLKQCLIGGDGRTWSLKFCTLDDGKPALRGVTGGSRGETEGVSGAPSVASGAVADSSDEEGAHQPGYNPRRGGGGGAEGGGRGGRKAVSWAPSVAPVAVADSSDKDGAHQHDETVVAPAATAGAKGVGNSALMLYDADYAQAAVGSARWDRSFIMTNDRVSGTGCGLCCAPLVDLSGSSDYTPRGEQTCSICSNIIRTSSFMCPFGHSVSVCSPCSGKALFALPCEVKGGGAKSQLTFEYRPWAHASDIERKQALKLCENQFPHLSEKNILDCLTPPSYQNEVRQDDVWLFQASR